MVEFFPVDRVNGSDLNSSYDQIMARTPRVEIERNRATTAHEATHYINSSLRSKAIRNKDLKGKYNGFYVVNRGGIYLLEPPFSKALVADYVPENLRGRIFPTYVTGATDWNDRPLYIVDEWVAFYNGGLVAVEDFNSGRHTGFKEGSVSGVMEMAIYTVALCLCILDQKMDHWYNFPEFRLFVIDQLKRSKVVYDAGRKIRDFDDDKVDMLLHSLYNNPANMEFRTFMDGELENPWNF